MQIELREIFGVANLSREISLDEEMIKLKSRGDIKNERRIRPSELEDVTTLVKKLVELNPRQFYGGATILPSDPNRRTLIINFESEIIINMQVISDPTDLPPSEFTELTLLLSRIVAQ